MSETKISEAAVEAASTSMEATKNSLEMTPLDRIRLMLAAALPHLTPQPAELADLYRHLLDMLGAKSHEDAGRIIGELHGKSSNCTCPSGDGSLRWPCPKHPPAELAEQQGVDGWDIAMKVRSDLDRQSCPDAYMCIAVESVMKHLAATGKQQVGEAQGDAAAVWAAMKESGYLFSSEPFAEAHPDDQEKCRRIALAARQPGVQEPVLYQLRKEIIGKDSLGSNNLKVKEKLNAWCEIPKSHYDAYLSVMGGRGPMGVLGHPDGPVTLELNRYNPKVEIRALYAAPPAQGIDLGHVRVIEMLLTLAETAYTLADNANDMAECENVDYTDFVAMSDALDALAELPDDQPGYVMSEPAKARWALRALIDGQRDAAPGVGNG